MSIRVEWPKEGVAVVVIDAPSTNNALTGDMLTGLAAAFRGLRADDATRVAVLTGGGSRAFCAGIDLKHADAVFKMDERDVDNDPVFQMEHASFPIVGAVRGFAINAGFELALACDVLLCAPCATFLDTHVKLGILPSWGLAAKLSRVIGPGAARRASLACRPVRADEARRLGLVVDVVGEAEDASKSGRADGTGAVDYGSPLMVEVLSLAHSIARSSPASVAGYKKIAVDAFAAPLGAARREERARLRAVPRVARVVLRQDAERGGDATEREAVNGLFRETSRNVEKRREERDSRQYLYARVRRVAQTRRAGDDAT